MAESDPQTSPTSSDAPAPSDAPALTVVIPAYNEALRIGPLLQSIERYAANRTETVEVIVVDDGSGDDIAQVVNEASDQTRDQPGIAYQLIVHDENRGKGAAVRTGMLAATGERVLMCDADGSTPIEEVDRLAAALDSGAGIAIGSRAAPGSIVDPPQPPLRRFMGWGFRTLRRAVMLGDLHDTQCGFKLFTHAAARDVFAHAESTGFAFDCEVLAIARRLDLRIEEVGVNWANRGDSTLTVLDAPRMFADLFRIKRRVKKLEL